MTTATQAAKVQEVTVDDLVEIFSKKNGARFVSFVARTDPSKQLEKGAPKVYKVAEVFGIVNWDYENAVNNQRQREGLPTDFVSAPRKWGVHIKDSALVENKGNYYLVVKVERSMNHYYIDQQTGERVDTATVEKFLKEKEEGARQGVEKIVRPRDYALINIQSIRHEGVEYVVLKHRWIDEHVRATAGTMV